MTDELVPATSLTTHPLLSKLAELGVEPSLITRALLQLDLTASIEDTLGKEIALEMSRGFPIYVGHQPVGVALEQSVTQDLQRHGYNVIGSKDASSSFYPLEDQLEKRHGPENVVKITSSEMGLTSVHKEERHLFLVRPYEREPQYLEIEQLPKETVFEFSMKRPEERYLAFERGELTVMEYGEPVITEVYTVGISSELGLLKFGTGIKESGQVTGYKTLKLKDIQRYIRIGDVE